jgi:hypothetical protein
MPAGIRKKLVQSGTFRFCAGDCIRVLKDNFVSALLRQFSEVIKLCFSMLVAGIDARVENRAFAETSRDFDFGR